MNNNIEDGTKNNKKTTLSSKLISGAIAGIIGTLIIYPVDIIKTHLQNNTHKTTGLICFKKITQEQGIRGLYRGLLPNLIGITPEKAIKLAVNDYMRQYFSIKLSVKENNLPIKYGVFAGMTAGFCQVIATNPMEIVKIRMQTSTSAIAVTNQNIKHITLAEVVQDLGLKGLYKGTSATLLRDVPFSMIFFPTHSFLKNWFLGKLDKNNKLEMPMIFASGIFAGAAAAMLVTPMDVVKTRFQVELKEKHNKRKLIQIYKDIWTNEGKSRFFRGAIPRAMINAPLFAISLMTYEIQQKYFIKQ